PRDGGGEIALLRNGGSKLAFSQGIARAAEIKAESRRATRHRLQEHDAETLAGRRHHEQISYAEDFRELPSPDATEETHALGDPNISRNLLEAHAVIALANDHIDDIVPSP